MLRLQDVALTDAFQSWIYTSGEGGDQDARDVAWVRISQRFDAGFDWRDLEAEQVSRWYAHPSIFLRPFHDVGYGIAQLGALQVWRNSLRNLAGALADYRRALALGDTRPLPGLFEAAGAHLTFDTGAIGELVALVEERLIALEQQEMAGT